jgi:hypothetical protein
MPQSARAGIAYGNRFADESWGAFVVNLSFHCESEAGLDDDVFVMRGCAGTDSWPVGAEAVGVDQHGNRLSRLRISQIISIAITTFCLCLSLLKASPIFFIQPYFIFRSLCPSVAPRSSSIRAFASTHSPLGLPRTSHGTILTFGLFRILFTLPALASEYMYNVPFSSANHNGVATGLPVFL